MGSLTIADKNPLQVLPSEDLYIVEKPTDISQNSSQRHVGQKSQKNIDLPTSSSLFYKSKL